MFFSVFLFFFDSCNIAGTIPSIDSVYSRLIDFTAFNNRFSCVLPNNLISKVSIFNDSYTTLNIMKHAKYFKTPLVSVLMGNQIATNSKDELPEWVDLQYADAPQLYIGIINKLFGRFLLAVGVLVGKFKLSFLLFFLRCMRGVCGVCRVCGVRLCFFVFFV